MGSVSAHALDALGEPMDDGTTRRSLPTMPADGAPASERPSRLPGQPTPHEAARGDGDPGAGRGRPGSALWAWVPLAGLLVVQAVLSLRLLHADTAFQDEALYLWAGHREWAHWLHGAPLPPVLGLLLRRPRHLPPARRPGRPHRRPGRRPGPVPGLHARRHQPGLGHHHPAVRPPGRVLRRRPVRHRRPHPAPRRLRHLRRPVHPAHRPRRLVRRPRRRPRRRHRLDARRRHRPRPRQRHRLLHRPARPRRHPARVSGRLSPPGRQGGSRPRRHAGDRHRGPAGRRDAHRGQLLPDRHPPDDLRPGWAAPTRRCPCWTAPGPGPA